jgi:Flp pilus assembly protein TadB
MQSTFISNIRNILSNNGYRSLSVDIYDSLPSNNSNTTINIVLSIKSHQPLNDENIVSTLELHKSELPFTVNNISTVDSYYNYSSTSLLLIIGVAVASVFVLLLIIGIVILVLILISIKFFKKNRNKHNKKSTPATYVSLTDE